jgi:hypothetical protein
VARHFLNPMTLPGGYNLVAEAAIVAIGPHWGGILINNAAPMAPACRMCIIKWLP